MVVYSFTVCVGSIWDRCRVDVRPMQGRRRVDVGSMWGRCRVDMGSMLGRCDRGWKIYIIK